jgi:hypothetical protein
MPPRRQDDMLDELGKRAVLALSRLLAGLAAAFLAAAMIAEGGVPWP